MPVESLIESSRALRDASRVGLGRFGVAVSEHHRLYCTAAWRHLRLAQLRAEPLCRMCKALGQLVPATVADHVKPHRGDLELFRDPDNLQSLCARCHSSHKQAQENHADGLVRGAGVDGLPLDLNHPWHSTRQDAAEPRSCASTLMTAATLAGVAIARARAHGAPASGIAAGVGGGQKSSRQAPQTACVPSFATCHNSGGGA